MPANRPYNEKIRTKLRRFVDGKRNPRDLDEIFLWIRSKSYGAKIVKDIGDFVAHAEEKNSGFAWRHAAKLSQMFRYQISKLHDDTDKKIVTMLDLDILKDGVVSTFELENPASIKKRTRFGKTKARKLLVSALNKISVADGRYIGANFTNDEQRIWDIYNSVMIVQPAFSEAMLITEFVQCLQKNDLIDATAAPKIIEASHYISIYAVEKMHFCNLVVDGNPANKLTASVRKVAEGHLISVGCYTEVEINGKMTSIGADIFTTTCIAEDWADDTLWAKGLSGNWTVPIELTPNWKLTATV
jgi:hypothetical protein